jgi:phage terminase large subunit
LDQPKEIEIPQAFQFLFEPARYKCAFGGRGSAKSRSFAAVLVLQAAQGPLRVLCCREVQNSIKDSVKQLIDDTIDNFGLRYFFSSTDTEITGRNGSRFTFAGLRTNANSIKSIEGLDRAWVEEASAVSHRSIELLVPTVRKTGSEIWFTWNPETEFDAVDMMFRGKNAPPDAVVRRVGMEDNPWFPEVLKRDAEHDLATDPEKYAHVWGGSYRAAPAGAYYGKLLSKAQNEGRIGRVPHDPGAEVHVAFDLGVGQNMCMVFSQWVGRELRVIDYLEGDDEAGDEGYPWFARRMKAKPYAYAPLLLPHDGRTRSQATGKSRAEVWEGLGFQVELVPNIGVDDGIQAVKRMIPMMWIDAVQCAEWIKAMREYREGRNDEGHTTGPHKDWTNHPADAMRMLAVAYEAPQAKRKGAGRGPSSGGWMG